MNNAMMVNASEVKTHNPIRERIFDMEKCIAAYMIEMEIYELEAYRIKENNELIANCKTIKEEAIKVFQETTGRTYNVDMHQAIATYDLAVNQLECLDDEEMRIASMRSVEENEDLKATYQELVGKLKHNLNRDFRYKA